MARTPSSVEVDEVIEAFYAAAAGEAMLERAVRLTQLSFDAASAQIFTQSIQDKMVFPETFVAHNQDTHADLSDRLIEEKWDGLDVGTDPRMAYSATLPAGFVFHDAQFITDPEIDRHPFYQDFLRGVGLRYGMGANLEVAGAHQQTLLSFNHSEEQGHMTQAQFAAFSRIVPHAMRAMQVRRALEPRENLRSSLIGLLSKHGVGVALLDSSGGVIEQNRQMERFLDARDGMLFSMRKVVLQAGSDNNTLRNIIRLALQGNSNREVATPRLFLSRPSGKRPYILDVLPVADKQLHNEHMDWDILRRRVSLVLIVRDPSASDEGDVDLIRNYFQLTAKEAQLAGKLARGISLDALAVDLRITKATARAHLRAIFRKTDTQRQSELVAVLGRLLG